MLFLMSIFTQSMTSATNLLNSYILYPNYHTYFRIIAERTTFLSRQCQRCKFYSQRRKASFFFLSAFITFGFQHSFPSVHCQVNKNICVVEQQDFFYCMNFQCCCCYQLTRQMNNCSYS